MCPRADYLDLRDRIDDVRVRARRRSDVVTGQPQRGRVARATGRFRSAPSSTCGCEDRPQLEDQPGGGSLPRHDGGRSQLGERVLIPAGSEMRGIVSRWTRRDGSIARRR